MNQTITEKNWQDLKSKILIQWTKLTDQDIESVRGDLRQLVGKIEKTYGVAKNHAERQYEDFKKSTASLIRNFTQADSLEMGQISAQDTESAVPTPPLESKAV